MLAAATHFAATEPASPEGSCPGQASPPKHTTYAEILKSTVLIGGSSALNLTIGIVRTKAMAVLLGPAGFGLMGVYSSIADLARSLAQMGIASSGVRQIAESAGSGDIDRIARTVLVLRRTAIVLGLIGALILLVFARQISRITFGTDAHADAVALLSIVVFLRLVGDGQGTLIQGMRRVSDLAKMGVLGALFGTLVSIPIVYFMRQDGVVPSLVAVTAVSTVISWWYARKVQVAPCRMAGAEVRHEAASLLKLGLAFMASGLLTLGAAYVVRLIVLRQAGLQAAGFYHAAWTLGGMYVGFVLQAMGADFYPRLVGVIEDNTETNRLVNEQAQVSLLLAAPGVIATLTFASLVVALLYSREFAASVDVLRWICLGMALRVITWPMGYIIVAKNRRALFFGAELAWTVVNVGLSWLCVSTLGLVGAGIAFFGSYVFHGVMVYAIVRRLSGFRWHPTNQTAGLLFVLSIGLVFCAFQVLPAVWAIGFGALATVASGVWSARALLLLLPAEQLPSPLRRWARHPKAMTRFAARQDAVAREKTPVTPRALHIWIDLDNTPHVPFFKPIVDELRARGCAVTLTARDAFQVTDLARLHGLDCVTIGSHFGRNKVMKGIGLLVRSVQLLPTIRRCRPDIAVSHGSRAQALAAKAMALRSVVIADYEHVTHVTRADCMIVPQIIPTDTASKYADRVLKYPGIKEDVYAASFRPDRSVMADLGLSEDEVIVTVRPPATEAHYHNPESEALFDAVIALLADHPRTRIVLLPRNGRQERVIAERWARLLTSRKMFVPARAVDGLNLVWHSDLVISGGGTMNREAAALGVPVYSIFRGTIGAVDRYLATRGRLILLATVADVRDKIILEKRTRGSANVVADRSALETIVDQLIDLGRER